MDIVLSTWNISECVCAKWDINKGISLNPSLIDIIGNCNEIIDLINRYDIDVICFQEFPLYLNNEDIIVRRIISGTRLKYYCAFDTYPTFLFKNGCAGVSVFSKYKIVSKTFSLMDNPNISKVSKTGRVYYSFDKGLITARILVGKEILTIVTGHGFSFSPFEANAEDYPNSFRDIARCAIHELDFSKNVVVLGDFNSEKLFDILPELDGVFKENLLGPTTIPGVMEGAKFKVGRKLDYFLTASGVSVDEIIKVKSFSDHYLCIGRCKTN